MKKDVLVVKKEQRLLGIILTSFMIVFVNKIMLEMVQTVSVFLKLFLNSIITTPLLNNATNVR